MSFYFYKTPQTIAGVRKEALARPLAVFFIHLNFFWTFDLANGHFYDKICLVLFFKFDVRNELNYTVFE